MNAARGLLSVVFKPACAALLRLSTSKKQEAERLRLLAAEEAKAKKQAAEQAAKDRAAAVQAQAIEKKKQEQLEKEYKEFQKQEEQKRLVFAKQAEKAAAIDSIRINDQRWDMVFVDQAQAAASHRKREDYIISGLNYSLLYPPGGYPGYVASTRDGYRSGTLKNLTSSNIWWWKVDCGRKRYKDSLSLTNLDSVDHQHAQISGADHFISALAVRIF